MLLGIPEQDQEAIRDAIDEGLTLDADGQRPRARHRWKALKAEEMFADVHRLAGRAPLRRPDDPDAQRRVRGRDTAVRRKLTRAEILVYVNNVAAAGNETATRLIGWTGKVLAEHPDQLREVADEPGPRRRRS